MCSANMCSSLFTNNTVLSYVSYVSGLLQRQNVQMIVTEIVKETGTYEIQCILSRVHNMHNILKYILYSKSCSIAMEFEVMLLTNDKQ